MDVITELISLFSQFPGIGPRQAKRFVYFLLTQPAGYHDRLVKLIGLVRQSVQICQSCYRYFPKGSVGGAGALCAICSDPTRDHSTLLVVGRDVDLENIERSHTYHGLYFVLGGAVPILEKSPESRVRSRELVRAIEKRSGSSAPGGPANAIKEIIFALNLTAEGENTEEYIRTILRTITAERGIKLTSLGRGLSTGLELEYSDGETLKNAIRNRG